MIPAYVDDFMFEACISSRFVCDICLVFISQCYKDEINCPTVVLLNSAGDV